MKGSSLRYITVVTVLLIAACTGNDPGPLLKGTWQMGGLVPMTITFRPGETEAMGMIEKVSYKVDGNDVLVTYKNGMAKGTTVRYTMTGQDTARMEFGALRRVSR